MKKKLLNLLKEINTNYNKNWYIEKQNLVYELYIEDYVIKANKDIINTILIKEKEKLEKYNQVLNHIELKKLITGVFE